MATKEDGASSDRDEGMLVFVVYTYNVHVGDDAVMTSRLQLHVCVCVRYSARVPLTDHTYRS